jgi:predicted dehydrogenase
VPASDIRYAAKGAKPELAGGAMMDAGVYAVNGLRFCLDAQVTQCTAATCKLPYPDIDQTTVADFEVELPSHKKIPGHVEASLHAPFSKIGMPLLTIKGSKATLEVKNYLMPSIYHYITVTAADGKQRTERVYEQGASTYEYQLRAFVKCVEQFHRDNKGGLAVTSTGGTADDPLNSMAAIDMVYEKAGLKPRQGVKP